MKNKKKVGLKMQTKLERSMKGLFGSFRWSKAWLERKDSIVKKIAKKTERVQVRKAERTAALKEGKPVVYSIK